MIELSPSRGVCWLHAALLLAALALGLPNAMAQLVSPVIVSHPQSQTAAVGADVVFNIAVTNTASLPLTNRLRKAGQNIATNIVNERSTSFTLRNVQTNDASTYSIGVLNAAANRLSSNATLTVFKPVAAAGYSITAESCLPANGVLDPGETVTVGFALSATNGYSAANLVATLEETNGVVASTGPQTYGTLPADSAPVTRSFTFTANGTCGGQVRATLRLFDGSSDWGRVTVALPLGITTANGPECCSANLADLAVTISNQPEVVALASNVTWTITVTNRGPETAHDVVVTNRLAPELLYLSAQAGAGACAVQQGVLVCQIDEVPANSSWRIAVTTLVDALGTGSITNSAGVTGAKPDPNFADNQSAVLTTQLLQTAIRISNTSMDEGEFGTRYAVFDVRLSFPIQRTVTVQYSTADFTATAGIDYLPQSGTVTFPPGSTEQQIVIPVLGDLEPEPVEAFVVNLHSNANADVAIPTGRCSILPDEALPPPPNTVQQLWSVVTTNFSPVAVAVNALGQAWVAGAVTSIAAGTTYGVVKYDENGSVLWTARRGKLGNSFNEQPAALALDDWGNAYVTGSAGTVKFDPNGNELWASTNFTGVACAVDLNGNFCVTDGRGSAGYGETRTAKLASDGTTLWDKRYKYPVGIDDAPKALAVDRDGSVCVAVYSKVIKYGPEGNLLWSENASFLLPSMAIDHFGDVYLTGIAGFDITTRKYQGIDGVPLWTAQHRQRSLDDRACRIVVDHANNIYVAGTEDDADRTATPIIIKYDSNGNELWEARFLPGGGCSTTDMAVDLSGNVYVAATGGILPRMLPTGPNISANIIWMLDSKGYRRWVNYTEAAGPYYSTVNNRSSPYLALNGSGRVWMASHPEPGASNYSGLVSLLPYIGLGLPKFDGPFIFETNSTGEVSVKVQASGDPPLHYQWYYWYSLMNVVPGLNWTNSTLALREWPDHVTIFNRFGSVATPSLTEPYTIRSYFSMPFPQAIASGESLTFGYTFSLMRGDRNIGYQWLFQSRPLLGETNLTLTLSNVQSSDSGDYQLVATNDSGVIFSQPTRVTVVTQIRALSTTDTATELTNAARVTDRFGNEYSTSYNLTTKRDSDGNLLWTSPVGGQLLAVDENGNAYVAWFDSTYGAWASFGTIYFPNLDVFTAKLDDSGRHLWTSRFNGFENGRDVPTSLAADAAGNVWVGCYSSLRCHDVRREEDSYRVCLEVPVILRYDTEGTLLWSLYREGSGMPSPSGGEIGPFVKVANDGDLVVSWRTNGNVKYHEVPVAGLPTLVSRPLDRVANADEPVTLAVEAQGQGPLLYHWRRDGVFIPGATNAALEFAAVQFEDAGDYSVEIRNQLGAILTPEARLTVHSPPKFRLQPQNTPAYQGGRVTFTAGVVGSPPLAYQWWFNGLPLASATNVSLVISNVTPAVTGFYTLVVTNAYGAVTSAPARLEIWRPPVVEDFVGRTNVPLGGSIDLSIEATGTPPLRYQWRRNGVNIPSATNFTYTINQARLSDGGTYTVLVANGAGAVISDPILVVIEVAQQPAGDDFVNRTLVTGVTNAVGGTNRWATREVGEPLHAGKFGSNSVWYRWVAPVSGIATFRTVGSTFDTLLGVYTGTNVAALTAVAEDEDRGGFFTSELRFNAEQGTDYAIAIDGFFGQQGSFILTWEVETTAQSLPVITTPPRSQTVRAGAGVLLQVAATGSGLTYQWHFNGTRLAGANGAALAVNNVRPPDVGLYTVAITNSAGRGIESLPAAIEIGPVSGVQGQDKLEDLFGDTPPAGGIVAAALPSTFISVSAGTVDYQITSTRDATSQSWEPNHCGVIGGASKWFEFHATDDATVMIDTRGSTFDTVLAVYRKVGVLQLAQSRIDCSTDGQPGANWSRVSFQAQRGGSYYVVVDGANVNDLTGRAQLNWAMGRQPVIVTAPQYDLVRPGQRWRFSAGVTNAIPPPAYRWYHNNRLIPGATNDWYELASLQLTNAGIYTVAVSNALGEAWQLIAQLTAPTLTSELRVTDGTYRLTLAPVEQPGTATLLESSTNLMDWTPVQLHTNTAAPVTVTLPLNSPQHFFRTRPVQ